MGNYLFLRLFAIVGFFFLVFLDAAYSEPLPEGILWPQAMETIFSGREEMHFTVSWSGGVKIGDLALSLKKNGAENDQFTIYARVTDYGLFKFFYPVDDIFVTLVKGAFKLPYRYDVLQREGHRGSVTRRLSLYDQDKLLVVYKKNDFPEIEIDIAGPVHNEFSSFFITRSLVLDPEKPFMVPTFADKKRNEVKVEIKGREDIDSPFGRVRTVMVMPLMKFKGLYDKEGDTVIWLTDDNCRVPVKIQSKILIGSLVAELERYTNPACERY